MGVTAFPCSTLDGEDDFGYDRSPGSIGRSPSHEAVSVTSLEEKFLAYCKFMKVKAQIVLINHFDELASRITITKCIIITRELMLLSSFHRRELQKNYHQTQNSRYIHSRET